MPDFEALNRLRSQTLAQLREMVSEETELWGRYFDGRNTTQLVAGIEQSRARFRALWDRHEEIRRQMAAAGFMPPPAEPDALFINLPNPVRDEIERRLKANLEAARAEYFSASQEFRQFVAQGTGLPGSDGSLRAKQIAALHSAALHNYTLATRRFNAFLVDQKLPEE